MTQKHLWEVFYKWNKNYAHMKTGTWMFIVDLFIIQNEIKNVPEEVNG